MAIAVHSTQYESNLDQASSSSSSYGGREVDKLIGQASNRLPRPSHGLKSPRPLTQPSTFQGGLKIARPRPSACVREKPSVVPTTVSTVASVESGGLRISLDRSPAMDEVAFVESLFQPELRSSPQQSPTHSDKSEETALLISASLTPTSSSLPSSWPSSPRFRSSSRPMQTHEPPAVSPGTTLRLGVGPEEEEAFRQLLNEHEFDDTLAMTSQVENMVDHLQASSLLEPIELPKHGMHTGLLDPSLKDVFFVTSPMMLSPTGYGQPSFKMFSPTSHTPRGFVLDPHRTPRNSVYSDYLMPVQPLGPTSTNTSFASAPATSMSAIEALQQAVWSNNPNGNIQRLNPNSIKDVMRAATTAASASRTALAPSILVPTPHMQFATEAASPLWMPTALLTPTGVIDQNAPDLMRTISSKKSKARKPSHNHSTNSTSGSMASALASSLTKITIPKKRVTTPSSKSARAKNRNVPPVTTTSESQDSDEAESKGTKGKKCVEDGCVRRAQSNSRCKAHGGGARCQYDGPGGCTRSSQGGGFCRAHGGGKRCEYPDCTRGQQRKGRCYVHGGIRKCQTDGCEKKDRGNGFCISHGGGKRCVYPGCARSVRRGNVCQLHEDSASVSSAS